MNASERPTLVEITGARGVGKSTLHEHVLEALEARDVRSGPPRTLPWSGRLARRLALLPAELRSSYAFWQWQPCTLRDLRKFRARLLRQASRLQRVEPGSELLFLDEGIFQLALTLHARTAHEDMDAIVAALARWMHLPDVVIFIEAPEDVVVRRRRARGNAGDQRASRYSEAGRRALTALARTLDTTARTRAGVETLRVNNDEGADVAAAAGDVAEHIVRRVRQDDRNGSERNRAA